MEPRDAGVVARWLASLESRHLADRTFAEVRRALQALSVRYVERRGAKGELDRGAPFGTAGKRAAYAMFYGPLHFLTIRAIVDALGAAAPRPKEIVDLGCGSGAAGAAWALACAEPRPVLRGVDESPWAVAEAAHEWRTLGLAGRVSRGSIADRRLPGSGAAILLAWTANELAASERELLLLRLLDAARRGTRLLVVEPIARGVVPWWDEWVRALVPEGARDDRWRFAVERPETLRALDRAARLDHREQTARSLYVPGRPA